MNLGRGQLTPPGLLWVDKTSIVSNGCLMKVYRKLGRENEVSGMAPYYTGGRNNSQMKKIVKTQDSHDILEAHI